MSAAELDVNIVLYHPGDIEARLLRDVPALSAGAVEVRTLDNSDNRLNLAAAWNDLAFQGRAPYVAFVHSDVCVTRDWNAPLVRFLRERPEMGVVLPNPGSRWDLIGRTFPLSNPPTPQELDAWASWSRSNLRGKHTTFATAAGDTAVFFCAVMSRALFERLKGFDERVRFVGVNTEFERRVSESGLHTAMVHESCVWHQDAKSFVKAKSIGAFRDQVEGANWQHWQNALRTGRAPRWHLLPDEERRKVRERPAFRIGSSSPY